MKNNRLIARRGARAALAAALLLGAAMPQAAQAQSLLDRLNPFSSSPPAGSSPGAARGPADDADIECPSVDVRVGAGTFAVGTPGREAAGNDLRYQAVIGQMARECRVAAGTMAMRVGVQGRVILGPAGSAGRFDVPLRLAVVKEGPEPKTVFTRFVRVAVAVEPGQPNNAFTQVFEDVSFPLPLDGDLEAYIVYIGFDAKGDAPAPKKGAVKKGAAKQSGEPRVRNAAPGAPQSLRP